MGLKTSVFLFSVQLPKFCTQKKKNHSDQYIINFSSFCPSEHNSVRPDITNILDDNIGQALVKVKQCILSQ